MKQRKHIITDPKDNVTTVLDENIQSDVLEGGALVQPGIPFGHKVALTDIPKGSPVVKYGVTMGYALMPIATGDHVHVHNCK